VRSTWIRLAATALLAAAPCALVGAAVAAPPPQQVPDDKVAEFRARLEERKKEPWLARGGWFTNFDEASKRAREAGQPILFYAARSHMVDTVARGIEARILASDEFRAASKDIVLYIHFITKLPDDGHLDLARKVGYYGTPFAVCIDPDGLAVATLSERTLGGFLSMIRGAQEFLRIEARIAKGEATESERAHNLLRLAESGRLRAAEVRERMAAWKSLTAEETGILRSWIFELSVREDQEKGSALSKEPNFAAAIGRKYAPVVAEGILLPKGNHTGFTVMPAVAEYAAAKKDLDLFDKATAPLFDWYRIAGSPFAREEARFRAIRAKLVAELEAAGASVPKAPAAPPQDPKPAPGGDAPPK
jgi:hypothetical protein